jgi:cyclin B
VGAAADARVRPPPPLARSAAKCDAGTRDMSALLSNIREKVRQRPRDNTQTLGLQPLPALGCLWHAAHASRRSLRALGALALPQHVPPAAPLARVLGAGLRARPSADARHAAPVYLCALRAPPPPARRPAQTQTWGNTRPRTTAPATRSTRAGEPGAASASRSALDGSRSLSTLLQKRSEAEQQADLPDIDAADKENPLSVTEVRATPTTCARTGARAAARAGVAPACLHGMRMLHPRPPLCCRTCTCNADTPSPFCASPPPAPPQYVNSIYSYYYRVEPATAVSATYMTTQTDINDKMRAILVDWLVEVHLKFKLMPETLFLTVNLIDRYLAAAPVTRKNLQLVGVTAMLLASKYEEIWAPEVRTRAHLRWHCAHVRRTCCADTACEQCKAKGLTTTVRCLPSLVLQVRDFVYISDKAYTREQILGCEKGMLNTLGFHLTVPTPFQFLSRLVKAAGADKPLAHLAQFYVELALPDYPCLRYRGSQLAAAAMYCAIRSMRGTRPGAADGWTHALARHSRYTEAELLPCANVLARLQRKASGASLTAVFKKYSNAKFHEVAKLPCPDGLGEEAVAPSGGASMMSL